MIMYKSQPNFFENKRADLMKAIDRDLQAAQRDKTLSLYYSKGRNSSAIITTMRNFYNMFVAIEKELEECYAMQESDRQNRTKHQIYTQIDTIKRSHLQTLGGAEQRTYMRFQKAAAAAVETVHKFMSWALAEDFALEIVTENKNKTEAEISRVNLGNLYEFLTGTSLMVDSYDVNSKTAQDLNNLVFGKLTEALNKNNSEKMVQSSNLSNMMNSFTEKWNQLNEALSGPGLTLSGKTFAELSLTPEEMALQYSANKKIIFNQVKSKIYARFGEYSRGKKARAAGGRHTDKYLKISNRSKRNQHGYLWANNNIHSYIKTHFEGDDFAHYKKCQDMRGNIYTRLHPYLFYSKEEEGINQWDRYLDNNFNFDEGRFRLCFKDYRDAMMKKWNKQGASVQGIEFSEKALNNLENSLITAFTTSAKSMQLTVNKKGNMQRNKAVEFTRFLAQNFQNQFSTSGQFGQDMTNKAMQNLAEKLFLNRGSLDIFDKAASYTVGDYVDFKKVQGETVRKNIELKYGKSGHISISTYINAIRRIREEVFENNEIYHNGNIILSATGLKKASKAIENIIIRDRESQEKLNEAVYESIKNTFDNSQSSHKFNKTQRVDWYKNNKLL